MKVENYIKDKLLDYNSPLDIDAMWSELELQLDKKPNKTKGLWFWSKTLLSLVLFLVIGWFLIEYAVDQKVENAKIGLSEIISPQQKTTFTEKNTAALDIKNETLATQEQNTSPIVKTKTANKLRPTLPTLANTSKKSMRLPEVNSGRQTYPRATNSSLNSSNIPNSKTSKPILVSENNKANATTTLPIISQSNLPTLVNEHSKIFSHDALPLIDNNRPFLINWNRKSSYKLPPLKLSEDNTIVVKKEAPKNWRASVNFGATKSLFRYQTTGDSISNFASPYSLYESTQNNSARNNFTAGLSIAKLSSNGFIYGLDVNYLNHGVRYVRSHLVTVNADIIEERKTIYLNEDKEFLGQSSQLEEKTITQEYEWKFENYHKLQSIQLLPMLGYLTQINQLDLSLSIGPGLNYFYKESGQIIDQNNRLVKLEDLEDLANVSEDLNAELSINQTSKLFYSARVKAEIGYKLNNNYRLFAAAEAGKVFGNTANQSQDYFTSSLNYSGWRTGLSLDF